MSVSTQRFPPEFEDWASLPFGVRLSLALMVVRFRSPTYLLSRHSLSIIVAGLDLALCLSYIPEHPMKLIASLGSASCAAVLAVGFLGPSKSTYRPRRS